MTRAKRAARPGGLVVIGLALVAVGIAREMIPLIGAGGLFIVIGGVGLRRQTRSVR